MRAFTLVVPHDLKEAAEAARKPGAALKAAGIDLLDRLKERKETHAEVVNLIALRNEMAEIAPAAGGGLRIGALATLTQLSEHEALRPPSLAALRESAGNAATPQVRNRATVGGNLLQKARCWYLRSAGLHCLHGGDGPSCLAMTGENRYHSILGYHNCVRVHPSSIAPALMCLEADVEVLRGGATVRMPLLDLFPKEPTAEAAEHTLQPGDVLTAILIPAWPAGARSAYRESREKLSFDWPTTAAAVRVLLDGGAIREAAICLGAVAPVPLPRPEAARLLVGQKPGDDLFQRVCEQAFADAAPLAQNGYKVQVGKAVLREALQAATR